MGPERGPLRLRPKRSLGQNFLTDSNIARKIVRAIRPAESDILIEIGPGDGALTRHLQGSVKELILVEIDPRAVLKLRETIREGRVTIVQQDVLLFDLTDAFRKYGEPLRIAGNIPYNITSPILFHILDHRQAVRDATLMVQREVALRLVAGPGSREYGIPSVFFQCFAKVKKLFDVPPTAFFPKPEVWSSLIRVSPLPLPAFPLTDEPFFRSLVRGVFGQRRKMLRHSLKRLLPSGIPPEAEERFDLRRRPEALSVRELTELSNILVRAATGSRNE